MIFSTCLAVISSLAIAEATPMPKLSKRCSSFLEPEILQILNESVPSTSFDNTWGDGSGVTVFQNVESTSSGTALADRIYQVVGFTNVPQTATACELTTLFPLSFPLTTTPTNTTVPLLDIYTFGTNQLGLSSALLFKNNYTWSSLSSPSFTDPPATHMASTQVVADGLNHTISEVECPWTASGGKSDIVAFTLRIAEEEGSVESGVAWDWFSTSPEGFGPGPTGFYLSYDC